jgi:hypothetical protein
VETVKLDATDQGQPIYERYGFVAEQAVERWQGSPRVAAADCEGGRVGGIDAEAFGADRSRVLHSLAARGREYSNPEGYALTRPGSRAEYLGPCVARTLLSAEALIRCALSGAGGPWFWDLLPANAEAVRMAKDLGFQPVRRLVRMYRGRPVRARDAMVFALAGFELG